jgi:hypothetical protein
LKEAFPQYIDDTLKLTLDKNFLNISHPIFKPSDKEEVKKEEDRFPKMKKCKKDSEGPL